MTLFSAEVFISPYRNNSDIRVKEYYHKMEQFGVQLHKYVQRCRQDDNSEDSHQGPVVQSIASLTSSLRGQFVKCFTTSWPYTLIFLLEK